MHCSFSNWICFRAQLASASRIFFQDLCVVADLISSDIEFQKIVTFSSLLTSVSMVKLHFVPLTLITGQIYKRKPQVKFHHLLFLPSKQFIILSGQLLWSTLMRRCSVLWEIPSILWSDTISTLRDYSEGKPQALWGWYPRCLRFSSTLLMEPPPKSNENSPMYWWFPIAPLIPLPNRT